MGRSCGPSWPWRSRWLGRRLGCGAPARGHGPQALRAAVLRPLGSETRLGHRPSRRDRNGRGPAGTGRRPCPGVAAPADRHLADHDCLERHARRQHELGRSHPIAPLPLRLRRRAAGRPAGRTRLLRQHIRVTAGRRAHPRQEPSAGDGRPPSQPGARRASRQWMGRRGAHRRERHRADRSGRHRSPDGCRDRGPRRAAVPRLRSVDPPRRNGRRRRVCRGGRVGDRAAGRRSQRG